MIDGFRTEGGRAIRLAAVGLPIAFLAVMAWARRWVAEDAFIDLRVVVNILDGHGPVFNAGERIEASTSPLWVLVLSVLGGIERLGLPISLELLAVLAGLFLTLGAMAMGALAAAGLHRPLSGQRGFLLPAGLLVVVGLSGMWDFATSGLETGLVLFWIAASFTGVVRGAGREASPPSFPVFALVGLGPLVRPELGVFSLSFLAALILLGRPWKWSALVLRLAAALCLPALYELFRAGYYGALVPNTALAKEATRAYWGQGIWYLRDFVVTYELWIPLVACAVLAVVIAREHRARSDWGRRAIAAASPLAGGLLGGLYVVRVGGDFMHARMLLPALFALCLPVFVVPATARAIPSVGALAAYAVVAATLLHPYPKVGPHRIANERGVYAMAAHVSHPVHLDDYRDLPLQKLGLEARALARRPGASRVVLVAYNLPGPARLRGRRRGVVVLAANIGILGYAAGPDVRIVDQFGLADPIAGRMIIRTRSRPGSEKALPRPLFLGRYVSSARSPSIAHAIEVGRAALACPRFRTLLAAVDSPLSARRFLTNIEHAWTLTRERIAPEPLAWRCSPRSRG